MKVASVCRHTWQLTWTGLYACNESYNTSTSTPWWFPRQQGSRYRGRWCSIASSEGFPTTLTEPFEHEASVKSTNIMRRVSGLPHRKCVLQRDDSGALGSSYGPSFCTRKSKGHFLCWSSATSTSQCYISAGVVSGKKTTIP